MIQPICCIENKKQLYCMINPQKCLQLAYKIQSHSLAKCKFCKSLNIVNSLEESIQCAICKSIVQRNIQIQKPVSKIGQNHKIYYANDNHFVASQSNLRILIIVDKILNQAYAQSLYCLKDILMKFRNINASIACLFYDKSIQLLQLREGGRVIKINYSTFELINDHFYEINQESLDVLHSYLQKYQKKQISINGSKLLQSIICQLASRTVIIWMTEFSQQYIYHPLPNKSFIETYAFIQVPKKVTNLNLSTNLKSLKNHAKRIFPIPYQTYSSNISQQQITSKIHYELYEIFNNAVCSYNVENSRQKKHPPQIITPKINILGYLNQMVVIRIGSEIIKGEKIQVRITYRNIDTNSNEIIIVNLPIQEYIIESRQEVRYLKLFLAVKDYFAKSVPSTWIESPQDRDIKNYFNQSSLLQDYQLLAYIRRPSAIYIVWPWVGFNQQNQPIFVYFFIGYYIKIGKSEGQSNQNLQILKQQNQKYHCRHYRICPLFYNNLLQSIRGQQFNCDSSDQQNIQDLTYYRFNMK